ncbi:tryptophan halogenase [Sphingopyxis italica]|uniref:Tryptophan halogenase n=1 Tax=Sphingopyxis italica TaxID=1129133 RepID=A0A7X6BA89_9SPHN|nr:tryptophan halogenase family protein [Sphingopyxis italica]NJB90617.1 tryptophan halogenase [Sphingopyxis italica]
MTSEPYRIVILGGGTAGWMCAAGLAGLLAAADYDITLIESDEIGTVGVGEATLPHIKSFNDRLGIDEAEFMRATRGTIKIGIEFVDWLRPGARYIHPFGTFGDRWASADFQHHWARARLAGTDGRSLQDYSFAVAAARANGFEHPNDDPKSIRSTYSYAYHFDAGLYAAYLRKWATARGIRRMEGKVLDVVRDTQSGDVASLTLASGDEVAGDLFIDCSGFRSLLLGQTMGVPWLDWSAWLPCDRALAVPCASVAPLTPYTRATAQRGGWTWRIPLQHRIGNGHVFSSAFCGEEEARRTLLDALDGAALDEPRLLRFQAGRRAAGWAGNVVAMGLASGFLEPLESTSIFLIQAATTDLAGLVPRRGERVDPRMVREFNRLFEIHHDRIRDFLVFHYTANERIGEPLWDHVRTMPLPDSLAHKLALFRESAVAPDYKLGLFSRDSWLSVLEGQGVLPSAASPLTRRLPAADLQARLDDLAMRIAVNAADMTPHADFIAGYCASEAASPPAASAA